LLHYICITLKLGYYIQFCKIRIRGRQKEMNKKIVGILILILLIGLNFGSYINNVNAGSYDTLLAYWSFNAGNANDDSGNGHNGAVNGATYQPGEGPDESGCFYFDNSDDYIEIPWSSVFEFADASLTICNWFTITDNSDDYDVFVSLGDTDSYPHIAFGKGRSGWNSGKIFFEIVTSGGVSQLFSIQTGDQLPKNSWIFGAAVINYPSSISLYIGRNGTDSSVVYQGSTTPVTYDIGSSSSPVFRIGLDTHPSSQPGYHHGLIDEVYIYDYALDQDQINDIYQSYIDNNPPNPPSNPNPASSATGVDVNAELSWSCTDPDGNPLTYDVYFGTNPTPSLVSINQTGNTYKPATMSYLTPYYWKIVAWDNHGESTDSPIWSFTTTDQPNNPPVTPSRPSGPAAGHSGVYIEFSSSSGDPDLDQIKYGWDWNGNDVVDEWTALLDPNSTCYRTHKWNTPGNYNIKVKVKDSKGAVSGWSDIKTIDIQKLNRPPYTPSDPSPSNGATGVDINTDLSWNCIDPNGDPVTYDIYFGTDHNPPLEISGYTSTFFELDAMFINTSYYWRIVAWDNEGESSSSPIWNFTTSSLGNYPPSINQIFPEENNSISGLVNIYGTASDPNGNKTLNKVEVKIDDKPWENASGTEYWNYSWNTIGETEGMHTIYARSYDGELYSNLSVVNVVVLNVISEIIIDNIFGGFGVRATIVNNGSQSVYDVNWSIDVEADIALILSGSYIDDIIEEISVNETKTIQTNSLRGIGLITVTVQAADSEKQATAFLLGPLVLRVNEI
jgi:hypothetical protein